MLGFLMLTYSRGLGCLGFPLWTPRPWFPSLHWERNAKAGTYSQLRFLRTIEALFSVTGGTRLQTGWTLSPPPTPDAEGLSGKGGVSRGTLSHLDEF